VNHAEACDRRPSMTSDAIELRMSRRDASELLTVLAAVEPDEPWKAAVDRVVEDLEQQLGVENET